MKKTILFDFSRGDLAMKNMIVDVSDGVEAIKNKIEKIIRTEKNRAPIYKNIDYGLNKERVIGKEYHTNIKEVQSLFLDLKQKIMKIDGVVDIIKWNKEVKGDKLIIEFVIETKFGQLFDEVRIYE